MKRITRLSFIFLLIISPSVQALSWAYPFVVWKGNVYEVKQEDFIKELDIGEIIGQVKTKPDEMTGRYYGNASNYYETGTEYYEIKGVSTDNALALKDGNQWVRAVYVHKAPFHPMNILTHPFLLFAVVLMVGWLIFQYKRNKNAFP